MKQSKQHAGQNSECSLAKQARDRQRLRRLRLFGELPFEAQPCRLSHIDPQVIIELDQQRQALEKETAQLRDAVLRQRAEFDNYRKRVLKEKDQIREATKEAIFGNLLAVIDNFERAIESARQVADPTSIREGVEMVSAQLLRILEGEGLVRIDALGESFDPQRHDALAVDEREDVPENQVVEVMLPGYTLNERTIRPAMVKVAKKPAHKEPAS